MDEKFGTTDDFMDDSKLPLDAPERRRFPPLLRRAWYSLNQAFRRRIAHLEITPDQFTVLRILNENASGITQKEICGRMSSDPNTIAAILNRMKEAGLVERKPHTQDRRASNNRITTLGRNKYERARAIAVALQTEILQALPESRREAFLRDLEITANACKKALESAAMENPLPATGD